MRNIKKTIILIILTCIIAIIGIVIYLNQSDRTILYKSQYQNEAWGSQDYGYVIYSNGDIEEYDAYNSKKELKKEKISSEELKELKVLANSVEDKYEKNSSMPIMMDAGTHTDSIYSERLEKWIVLSKSGDSFGGNNTEESKKILDLVEKIEDKYLD